MPLRCESCGFLCAPDTRYINKCFVQCLYPLVQCFSELLAHHIIIIYAARRASFQHHVQPTAEWSTAASYAGRTTPRDTPESITPPSVATPIPTRPQTGILLTGGLLVPFTSVDTAPSVTGAGSGIQSTLLSNATIQADGRSLNTAKNPSRQHHLRPRI